MAFYHCSPTAGPHGRLLPHPLSGKLGNGKKRILSHIKTNPWAAPLGQTMGFAVCSLERKNPASPIFQGAPLVDSIAIIRKLGNPENILLLFRCKHHIVLGASCHGAVNLGELVCHILIHHLCLHRLHRGIPVFQAAENQQKQHCKKADHSQHHKHCIQDFMDILGHGNPSLQ